MTLLSAALYLTALYAVYILTQSFYVAFLGPLSKIPGPKIRAFSNLPFLWSRFSGTELQETAQLHAQYGHVVRTAPKTISYTNGATAWKDIYGFKRAGKLNFPKDPESLGKPLNGEPHLIIADDETHARHRKILSHSFADRSIRELEPMLVSWVQKLVTKLAGPADSAQPTDMLKWYNCTTFDIMADLTFNESLDMLDNGEYSDWVKTIFDSIREAVRLLAIRNINPITKRLVSQLMGLPSIQAKAWEHFNYAAERVDRRIEKASDRPDLWGKIIASGGLTRGEQHSTAGLFMTAGTETTATLLSGTTYWLLREPEMLATLVAEIRGAFTSIPEMTMERVARLKYLDAVMHEGLRMYPPVPATLPRVVPQGGAEVCGTFLPEGVSVGVPQYATYHSPLNFTEPDSFRPQRWMGDEKYKNDQLACVEAFSVGPRNCIGKNLAYHEFRMILAATLLHYDLSLCEESRDWTDQKVYVLWEKKPLWCTLKRNEALKA